MLWISYALEQSDSAPPNKQEQQNIPFPTNNNKTYQSKNDNKQTEQNLQNNNIKTNKLLK